MAQVPPLSREAQELQRVYTGQVLRLRQWVDSATSATAPAADVVDIRNAEVGEGDEKVYVEGNFASPPVAAYLERRYPLVLHITHNADDTFSVSLSVPKSTNQPGGRVALIWPSKTVLIRQVLQIRRKPVIKVYDLEEAEGVPGSAFLVGKYFPEPLEIRIGSTTIDRWDWEPVNGELRVLVPDILDAGPVLIVTADGQVMQSSAYFRTP